MKNKSIKKVFPVVSVFMVMIIMTININAQVFTRILGQKQSLSQYLDFDYSKTTLTHRQPKIDFEKTLEKDKKEGKQTSRYAVKTDVSYIMKDGEWTFNNSGQAMWKIRFDAPHASSLSFAMNNVNLPEGTKMFIYGKKKKIIHGPITKENLFETNFTSDIIEDDEVEIAIISDQENYRNTSIDIITIGQGIKLNSGVRALGESSSCNYDVNCINFQQLGNDWRVERDAVAKILLGLEDHCTGTLINNQCQDLTANVLTAFHCIDGKNLNNFVFRFKYEALTPVCPGIATAANSSAVWITFNGATLRACRSQSDFALLLMNGNIIGVPNLTMAGWNRNLTIPQQIVTTIHHPRGDVKKISNDNETLGTGVSNMWSVVNWDFGLVEPGSSGCSLFDNNHRIIGQLNAGSNNIGCNSDGSSFNDNNTFGRFDVSWLGGGTNSTRLSNWLGGASPPMTVNSIRVPSLSPTNFLETLCSTANSTITLNDPIPGRTISWTVTNPGLFATTGGASTSGTTVSAILRPLNSTTSGSSVLTFTLTQTGCNPVTITKNLWLGIPAQPTTSPSNGYYQLNMGSYAQINITSATGAPNHIATWTKNGNVNMQFSSGTSWNQITPIAPGNGTVYAKTSNICGISPQAVVNYFIPSSLKIFPTIISKGENVKIELDQNIKGSNYKLTIVNQMGEVVDNYSVDLSNSEIDISKYSPGVYLLKFVDQNGFTSSKKLIVN